MKYFSTFSGVGGFDMGVPPDWECVGMSEIDKYANMVLRYRYRGVKNYGDIEKINYEELPDYDVQIGGSPCQDISVAGKRAGLAGLRSRLFFSYVALLKVKKPKYFVFENVKGLLSSNEGRDFAEVISSFSESGYDVWWEVLDSKDFGIPQHRERVFIFGTLGKTGFRKVFLESKNKRTDTKLQGQQANTITRRYWQSQTNGTYITESKRETLQIENLHFDRHQQNRIYGVNGVSPTLCRRITKIGLPTEDNTLSDNFDNINIRHLTPLESERLMGWPDNQTKYGIDNKGNTVEMPDSQRYKMIGNGVVPQVVRAIIKNIMESE